MLDLLELENDGFTIVPDALTIERVGALLTGIEAALASSTTSEDTGRAKRGEDIYGVRNVLRDIPAARDAALSNAVRALVEPALGQDCFAVRGILFDKTPGANWKVIWHQDLAIAVQKRHEGIAGWDGWSEKAGVVHVQPPPTVLEHMLTVRLHLDSCGPENGPLRVLPGTHRLGRLSVVDIARLRAEIPETVCTTGVGGALLMRPLLLHASSPAAVPGHRRVLHIEFATDFLPEGLEWYERLRPES